jgi:hypothetical protein
MDSEFSLRDTAATKTVMPQKKFINQSGEQRHALLIVQNGLAVGLQHQAGFLPVHGISLVSC